jgi:dihydroorotate dehydrogenase
MSLDAEGRSRELFPKCVIVKPWKGVVLNSVGLAGPGAQALFEMGRWQKLGRPFFLSFMSVAPTQDHRYNEAAGFVEQVLFHQADFTAPFGIQVNLSCPNTGHDPAEIAKDAKEILGVFQGLRTDLQIPIVPKLNVLYPVEALKELESLCDAICISNTIPWGKLPADINWCKLFNVMYSGDGPVSPLFPLGGGGLSGWPLLPLVEEWVKAARGRGIDLPINAGGGILKPDDVDVLAKAGADSVFLGSIAILRGWRLRKTIQRAHKLLGV